MQTFVKLKRDWLLRQLPSFTDKKLQFRLNSQHKFFFPTTQGKVVETNQMYPAPQLLQPVYLQDLGFSKYFRKQVFANPKEKHDVCSHKVGFT